MADDLTAFHAQLAELAHALKNPAQETLTSMSDPGTPPAAFDRILRALNGDDEPDGPPVRPKPYQVNPRAMVNDGIAGLLTRDGAVSAALLVLDAAVAVSFAGWLIRRFGRRRAIAVTVAWFATRQVLIRGCNRIVQDAAMSGNPPGWLTSAKVPPWLTLTHGERRQIVAAIAARLRGGPASGTGSAEDRRHQVQRMKNALNEVEWNP